VTLNVALGQGTFFVRASVFESKEVALDIEQGNLLALDVH